MSPRIKQNHITFRLGRFIALLVFAAVSTLGSNEGFTPGIGTSNSNFVVFLADKDTDGTVELYAYSLGTQGIVKLNAPLVANGDVTSFAVSPDGLRVAYVADQDSNDRFELYVAKADGTSVTKVSNPTVNAASNVDDDPLWAPDSSRIAYRSNESDRGNTVFVLRTVQPDASDNVIVNPQGVTGSSVAPVSFTWSPDSSRIAYLADQDEINVIELYTSAADSATGNEKVNGTLPAGGAVTEYRWAPNGLVIAYRADQSADEVHELWTATPTGSDNVRVSGNYLNSSSDVRELSFSWAPDSSRITYIADETSDEVFNLYIVLPNGNSGLQVSADASTANGDVTGTPAWSPDSAYIAYVGNLDTEAQFELYISTPNVSLSSSKINDTLLAGDVVTGPFADSPPPWSPDSSGIAYIAQQDTAGVNEVYVGNPGGATIKVSGTLTAVNNVSLGEENEVWAPDGSRLLYESDQEVVGRPDLYTTLPTGAANIARITRTPVQNNSLKSFGKWAPDSSNIAYVSAQVSADVDELYMASPDGSDNQNISGPLVSGGDVASEPFDWAP